MKRELNHVLAVILLVLIGFFSETRSVAQTVVWDGSGDMIWTQPDGTSWTGNTYNSGNAVQFLGSGAGTVTLSGTITPGSVLVNSSAAYTFTGDGISGAATLTKSGTGVLTLLNTNAYTGLTTVNGGGILDVGTISNNAISNSSGMLLGTSGSSGVLQGNGTFTRTLSGTVTPGAGQVASQEGGFAARGGNLTVNFGGAGAEIALNTGGYVFGNNFIFGSTAADSKVILQNNVNINSTGGRTITVVSGIGGDAATSAELTGVVRNGSVSSVQIRKNGDGMLILSNSSNSFDGQVLINQGTLSISTISSVGGGNSSLGAASTVANGTVKIGSTTNTGRLLYTGIGSTTDRVIDLAGSTGGAILDQSGTGLLRFTSNFTATAGGSKTLTLQGSTAGTGEISGTIVNPATGSISLLKDGSGTWTLSGANTYSGDTRINAGILNITNNLALQSSAFDTSGGGVMTLGITTPTFGGLKGGTNLATAISTGYGNVTSLTLNPGTGASHSYSGIIANGAANMSLIKTGAGNQTLTGVNTFNGGTTIQNGTLTLDGGSDRLLTTGAVTLGGVSTTGKLVLGGTTSAANQTLTSLTTSGLGGSVVGGNSTTNSLLTLNLASGSTSFAGTLGGAGTNENRLSFTKSGAGTLILTATNNTYSGLTNVIDSGVLDVGTISSGALSANSGLLLGSSVVGSGNFGILQGNGSFTRTLSNNTNPGAGQVAGAAGGFAARGGQLTINFGGAGAQIGLNQALAIFGNNFVFGSSTADSKVVLINPINLNSSAIGGTRTFTVRAGIGGAAATSAELQGVVSNGPEANGIRKEGNGMLILSATNNYTGPTNIIAGTVQIGNGGTTGSITSTGAVAISNGAELAFNRSNLMTFSNTISGQGEVSQLGSGTTILNAANNYSGGTTVSDGALVANNTTGSATGSGVVFVESGATLAGTGSMSGATTITAGGFLTGGADIDAGTRGTLTFGGGLNASGSTWLVDLVETTSMDSDRIAVTGNLNITDAIFMDRFSGTFTETNTYTIATYTGTLTGTFLNWADDTDRTFTNGSYRINYNDGGAITLTAVPEPGALLSLLFILVPGWWVVRKRVIAANSARV